MLIYEVRSSVHKEEAERPEESCGRIARNRENDVVKEMSER